MSCRRSGPWLFRIAHNRALDHLRRYEARMGGPLDAVRDTAVDPAQDPGDVIEHQQAVRLAVWRFVELAPAQRSCVILKDVLEHMLEEIGVLLELSLPAVKAALHRGRVRLRELAEAPPAAARCWPRTCSSTLCRARSAPGARSATT
jgi:RNA polymerase sigma-70 factor (ECF subfamily)